MINKNYPEAIINHIQAVKLKMKECNIVKLSDLSLI